MCFSPEISATFAVLGIMATYFSFITPELRADYFYVITLFYTCMEILQTIQYYSVNRCDNLTNRFLTNIAYLLVVVQPLLWNVIFYMRSKKQVDKGIFLCAIVLCCVWIVWYTCGRLWYNYQGPSSCDACMPFYGPKTCTKQEEKRHLYWSWPSSNMYGLHACFFMYLAVWFVPGLLVQGTRKSTLLLVLTALVGVWITWMSNGTMIEFPSTWCYISIPTILVPILHTILFT